MNPKKRKFWAERLNKEKKRLIAQISELETTGLGDTMSDSLGELSVYDNHPADIGDELFERSKDVALRDHAHITLENIEKALDRIEDGTYGYCEDCGRAIPEERLEAVPWTNKCIQCQKKAEAQKVISRPIEEESLKPPFYRSFKDSADYTAFDGEDSLQSVMRFGSSDTPQDIPGAEDYKTLFPNSDGHIGIVDPADAIPSQPQTAKTGRKDRKTEP